MTVRDLIRPLPGVRRISALRHQVSFGGSTSYWERNYARGWTSGPGSYGLLGEAKAAFLNAFIRDNGVSSVIEFGCGDGHQLSLARYPCYVGLDVSRSAVTLCKNRFAADQSKSFFLYDGTCFADRAGLFTGDLAISLDVIYHLVEDDVFETYMSHLCAAGQRFMIIYSTNTSAHSDAAHVRHRKFTDWVEAHCPQWQLTQVTAGPGSDPERADFFVYRRVTQEGADRT